MGVSLHVYILAGGKSTRMGEEKGLLRFRGKPLIEHVLNRVAFLQTKIFIVTSNEHYQSFGFPLVPDLQKELGPAGAIDTLLHHSTAQKNLVIACDMPFVDEASIRFIIDESKEHELVVPIYHQFPEPLLAVYDTQCKIKWHEQIQNGIFTLSKIYDAFTMHFVDGNKMSESNPLLFVNLNSKEDVMNYENQSH